MPVTAFIALGSNMGDRVHTLERAIRTLQEHPRIFVNQVSTFYETKPVGGPPGQNDYLNAAAELQTDLAPRQLLEALLGIEQKLGRVRDEKDGPRTIDLDLLLYGQEIIQEEGLEVPHPRMYLRSFVLAPLVEIARNVVHPSLGATIGELWDRIKAHDDAKTPEDETKVYKSRSLLGMRALVTGSTSGIGRAVALSFARAGASILVHGRREAAAEEVSEEIAAHGVESGVILADLRHQDECLRLARTAWGNWGAIDVCVNNAGVDTLTGPAAKWSFDQKLQALLQVDLTATMVLSRILGRHMKERGRGVILNMGWDQAETGMEGDSGELFAAAKGAVMAFTRSLARSLAPEVRVNCLAPGWIRTAWGEGASEYWQRRAVEETPLQRWGTPEDVAATACWLASPGASFVTGQIIRINGGAVCGS